MSVSKVILFYSKKSKQSLTYRDLVESQNIDIETVSVDSQRVRDRLEDSGWGIEEVPSIIVFHDNNTKRVLTRAKLKNWFEELITNIQTYQQQLQDEQQRQLQYQQQMTMPMQPQTFERPTHDRVMAPPGRRHEPQDTTTSLSDFEDIEPTHTPNGIKGKGPSAKDLAKQMEEQRQLWAEKNDLERPFI